MASRKTFVVIRFSSMGDVLMTTPAVRMLKRRYPDSRILFVTKPAYVPLVQHNTNVDEVIPLAGSLFSLALKLAGYNPDCLIDLHDSVRSRAISALLFWVKTVRTDKGSKEREGMVRTQEEMEETAPPRPLHQLPHMAERHVAALAPLGVQNDGLGLDFYLPADLGLPESLIPFLGNYEFEAMGIGGQHFTKRLPEHKLVELLRSIDRPVVLLGGEEDAEVGARVAGTLGWEGRWNIVNACGKLSLLQTGLVISKASHVHSHDTGTMHMAAALGRPLTAIWGSTVPQFGMYPFRVPHADKEVSLPCRPCHKHGREACPLGHFNCMNRQVF